MEQEAIKKKKELVNLRARIHRAGEKITKQLARDLFVRSWGSEPVGKHPYSRITRRG